MSTLFRVVGFQKLAQAMRLHAHDVVDPSIEVGTASEHFDGNDRLFDMVRVAFGPFGDNVIQKMAKVRSFPERFRIQYAVKMGPNFPCADCFRGWKGGNSILSL